MSKYVDLASTSDIPVGHMRYYEINGDEVLISNIDGTFYAISNRCGHMNASLSDGKLSGIIVTCPFHSAQFNVTTGEKVSDAIVTPPPGIEKAPGEMVPYLKNAGRLSSAIKTHKCKKYVTRVSDGRIEIEIS